MLVVKNLPVNAGDVRDMGSIPGSGRFPRKEGMATHSSILAWRIPWTEEPGGLTVHRVTNSKTQLKQLSMHTTSVSTNNTQVEDIMNREPRAFFSCMAWRAIPGPLSKRKRRLDSFEAAQGAPRDPRRDSRGERSSVLAWRIPGTGEPGGRLSLGSHRVGHD